MRLDTEHDLPSSATLARDPHPSDLIDENELARMTGTSVSTLQKRRANGDGIPFSKVGKHVRYLRRDVTEFFEKSKVKSIAEWTARKASLKLKTRRRAK